VALISLVVAVGGISMAAVRDKQGRIVACYAKKSGDLRVLAKGTKCRRAEKKLRWNQRGPRGTAGQGGAPGTAGSTGPTGPSGAQGPSAASLLTVNTGNVPANVGVTHFLHPSGVSDYWGATTFADMLSPNSPIVARDLAVSLPNPPGAAGEFYKTTLFVNGAPTALTCTVEGVTDTTCGNSDASVPIAARSLMSFSVEVSAGSVSRRIRLGWRAVEPAP
jgi:hypothetical protein